MKIYCSRSRTPHLVGEITYPDDPVLTYKGAVLTTPTDPDGVLSPQDGWHYRGVTRQEREPLDERLEIDIWCSSCKTGHPQSVGELVAAAKAGRPSFTLLSRGAWDGIWER